MELKVPPPIVFLVTAALMAVLAAGTPGLALPLPAAVRVTAAGGIFALGVALGVLGLKAIHGARTTADPRHPERAVVLVTGGVYRYTRNPMYLGLATALLAWALWLDSAAALPGVPAFAAYITRFQIIPEERALAARFGKDYTAYCRSVRRWLPFPGHKTTRR